MRTSATGTCSPGNVPPEPRRRQPRYRAAAAARGFTLIEVLVVVVIVGIISATVLLSATLVDDARILRQEARRMASLIELAADEALLQGRDFGLEFRRAGYRFVEYDPVTERWYEVAGDELLRPRALPDDMTFELFIEDRRVLLPAEHARIGGDAAGDNERRADYAPHTLILSSGQLSPFNLQILERDRPSGFALDVTPAGNVEIVEEDDDAA